MTLITANKETPDRAVRLALTVAQRLKQTATSRRPAFDAATINLDVIHAAIYSVFFEDRKVLARVASVSGIDDVGKTVTGNADYVLTDEINAVIAKLDEILAWVLANYPLSADDTFAHLVFDETRQGGIAQRTMRQADAAPLATLLDELLALID